MNNEHRTMNKLSMNNELRTSNKLVTWIVLVAFTVVFVLRDATLAWAMHSGSTDSASNFSGDVTQAAATQNFQTDLFTGQATTAIPIFAPPGRKGMQPALALAYSSYGGNGWIGLGWNLGMGFVQRSTKKGVPKYDASDTFLASFQGVQSELVYVAGNEYRPKNENGSFLKFQFDGAFWTVWDKNGTRYSFGATSASRQESGASTFKWCLDRVTDTNGNFMTISYEKDSGQIYLSQIAYTGKDVPAESPAHTVEFLREPRTDRIYTLMSGSSAETGQRLRQIDVKVSGLLARRYLLEYAESGRTGRSILTGVTEYGTDGATSLPKVLFAYHDANDATFSFQRGGSSVTGDNAWNIRTAAGDRFHSNESLLLPNGDFVGVCSNGTGNGTHVDFGQTYTGGSGSENGVSWAMNAALGSFTANGSTDTHFHAWTYVYTAAAKSITAETVPSGATPGYFLNGSAWAWPCSNQNRDASGNVVFNLRAGWNLIEVTGYNQNNGFSFSWNSALASAIDVMNSKQFIKPQLVGDFNGDSVSDLAHFDPATGKVEVSFSVCFSFVPGTEWISNFGNNDTTPLVGDYNRDGKTDILMFNKTNGDWNVAFSNGKDGFIKTGGPWLQSYGGPDHDPIVGDFNGDGYQDIGTFWRNPGDWRVALSNGSSFTPSGTWLSNWGSNKKPFTGDFNGDGLTDILYVDEATGNWYVSFSDGRSFQRNDTPWATGFGANEEFLASDANGDGLTDIGFHQGSTGLVRIRLSNGVSSFPATKELDWVTFTLTGGSLDFQPGDFSGDGLVDPAIFSTVTDDREIATSSTRPVDLLSRIENGRGGSVTITYRHSALNGNKGDDDLPDLSIPLFLVNEVVTEDGLGNTTTTIYNFTNGLFDSEDREFRGFRDVKVIDVENNASITTFLQDDIFKGRVQNQEFQDGAGNPFTRTENTWTRSDPAPFPGIDFVYLSETNGFTFDGDLSFKQSRTTFQYDDYGNLTEVRNHGDVSVTGDELTKANEYTSNPSSYIMGGPSRTLLYEGLGTFGAKKIERHFYYDGNLSYTDSPTRGNLTRAEDWLDSGGGSWLPTLMTYDTYGNLLTVTDARGFTTTNTYDATYHIYITQIQNALGHTTQFTYEPRTGQVLTSTDANGQTTTNVYDPLGRITAVIGPLDSAAYPTVSYEYDLATVPNRVIVRQRVEHGQAQVYEVYKFVDGIGREIQTRVLAEPSNQHVVKGSIEFDSRGLVRAQYTPYFDSFSAYYTAPSITNKKTFFEYDPAGRRIRTIFPDGAIAQVDYQDWVQTATDPNGNQKRHFYDAYGRLAKVHEFNGINFYETRYEYDILGNLTRTVDNEANIAIIQYDSLSRKTAMTDPDMGNWSYAYDVNGNLTSQTDSKGQTMTFVYDALNRVTQKQYPVGSSVTYTYDTGANGIGRLSQVNDPSGQTSFTYDVLGRLIQETKTVSGSGTYTVSRSYDAIGRLKTLTYPDGETLTYTYNNFGDVETVSSALKTYITNVDYNAVGQITRISYGNGVTTDYTYDPETLRLSSLRTLNSQLSTLQDFTYSFDLVGNVTGITDYVNTATQSFTYDDLNRLTFASGSYGSFTYAYNSIGNMTYKEGRSFAYGGVGQPIHAVTSTSDGFQYQYDANGNLAEKIDPEHKHTLYTYDVENRLTQVETPQDELISKSVTLTPGWNFLSLPLIPEAALDPHNLTIQEGLGSLGFGTDYTQLSRFNELTKEFEHFVNHPFYDDFSNLEMGRGYQIFVSSPTDITWTVTGHPIGETESLSLKMGYNLIGNPCHSPLTVQELLNGLSLGLDYNEVLRYDKATGSFTALSQIETVGIGESVYVYALRDATWTLPSRSTTTTFTYDGDGGRVKKSVGSTETVYVGGLYESTNGQGTKYIYLGDQRIASRDAQGSLFYHTDHLGGSNVITDEVGTQKELLEYTPYGSVFRNEGTEDVEHKFTGQRLDASTGLYFYNARYYDPELGRFISADSIVQDPSNPQTLNRYTYANNNPVNFVDPSGYGWFSKLMGFIAAAFTFVLSGGNYGLSLAAFNAVDTSISAYQSGASLGQSIAAGAVGFTAAYAGGKLGAAYGNWAGLGDFGSQLFGSIGANVAGSSATAAVLGGDVGEAALGGLAAGTISGMFGYNNLGFIGLPLAGGTSAEIQGGDFWEGALEGGLAFAATAGIQALRAGRPQGNPTKAIIRQEVEGSEKDRSALRPQAARQKAQQDLTVQKSSSTNPAINAKQFLHAMDTVHLFVGGAQLQATGAVFIGASPQVLTYGSGAGPAGLIGAGILVVIGGSLIVIGTYVEILAIQNAQNEGRSK